MSQSLPEEHKKMLRNKALDISNILWDLVQITKPITVKHIESHEAKWPIEKQYLKVYEEVGEAQKAYERNLPNKNEEHMDIVFSVLTLHHFYDMDKEQMLEAIYTCLVKFELKGWI